MASLLDNILENVGGLGAAPDLGTDMDFANGAAAASGLFGGLPVVAEEAEAAPAPNWQRNAGQAPPNLAARQKENTELLASHRQGGSTSRYYTRQLYREMLRDKDTSAENRINARNNLRIQGAPNEATPGLQTGRLESGGLGPGGSGGMTDAKTWGGMFPKDDERRTSKDGLPPPVTGGNWSSIFKETRANDFGAANKGQKFNPQTGRLEAMPQKSIAQSTKETQDILDGIMRMSGQITAIP